MAEFVNKRSKKIELSTDDKIFYAVVNVVLTLITIIVLYPLIYVVSASFSSGKAILAGKVWLYPVDFSLEGYQEVFKNHNIWIGYGNTIFYTVVATALNVFFTMVAAYPLSRRVLPGSALSVHLADWPQPLEGFDDDGVLQQTADARDIIAVALKLRNEHQIKVRQPLAKLYLSCDADEMAKISVFEKNILDELNIKELVHVTDASVLEDSFLTLNFRAAGAVLKQNVNKMKQALEAATAEEMAAYTAKAKAGEPVLVSGFDTAYDPAIFTVSTKTKAGIVSAEAASGAVVALDVVLTDDLIKEGLVRDTVRQCQLVRKEAGYEVEQRVVLSVETANDALLAALKESKDHMASELLADEIVFGALADADFEKTVSIDDGDVVIRVKKA